jgi:undecaprenyl-diphosphatase
VSLRVAYEHEPLASVDEEVAEWAATSMPGWLVSVARALSAVGGWAWVTVLTAAVVVLLASRRNWVDAGFVLLAVAGSQIVVTALKAWIARPRPDAGSAVPLPDSFAFPSGHATTGIAAFGAFAIVLAPLLPAGRARAWFWAGAVVVGLGTGLSRLVLGVHWVSDVLAGWCLGLAWLSACLLVREAALARGQFSARRSFGA